MVVAKELPDNALDACEEAGTAPEIDVTVSRGAISITDNGPGIAADTVVRLLDYQTKTSSREAYVGPSRGAQGNALQALLAM
ncbi:MAG: ATP-binding protein, partial [Ktedonobacterales bacterium]